MSYKPTLRFVPIARFVPIVPFLTITVSCAAAMMSVVFPVAGEVPEAVVEILGFEDQRVSGPGLHAFLADESPKVRARAALATGRIGRVEDVARLTPLLEDPDPEVRRMAAFALGEVADSTAAVPLVRLLLRESEPDAEVRLLSVEALGKLAQGADACRLALHDFDATVQRAALLAAWKIPVHDVVPEILQLARHKLAEVRYAAAYCLMRFLGAPASGRTAIPGGIELTDDERRDIAAELLRLTRDGDVDVALQAIRGLRSSAGTDVEARLRELMEHADWRVRVETVRALAAAPEVDGEAQPRGITPSELGAWVADPNPNVGAVVLQSLASAKPEADARAELERHFGHPRPWFGRAALSSWASLFGDGPVSGADSIAIFQALSRFQESKQWTVRAVCIELAQLLPDDVGGPVLGRIAQDEARIAKLAIGPYLAYRVRNADQAAQPGIIERCDPELATFATHPDPMVRLMTLEAVRAELQREDAVPAEADWTRLESLLREARARASEPGDTDVRQQVVDVAATFADSEAGRRASMVEILRESVDDPNYIVRQAAIQALESMEIDPGRSPEPVEAGRDAAEYRNILGWAERDRWAVVRTAGIEIVVKLLARDAPLTCWNFAGLAEAGFYDGGNWHRVVPNFVVQDGCPRGDGWGGPDHQIRCEINRNRYTRGAVGMALSGKDTGGSQFFITHSAQPHLDGGYTVFGHVVAGLDASDEVSQTDPIESIRILDRDPRSP